MKKPIKILALITLLLVSGQLAQAQGPKLGAIRWDAWTGTNNSVGIQVERSLSPNQFHFRVPFYGEVHDTDSVTIDATQQIIMDQEIQYAKHAGLDYWAFLWYPSSSGLDESRRLYYSSAYKSLIDYCLIIESSRLNAQIPVDSVVAEFADPSYVRVLGNRPLLYFFGSWALTLSEINELRTKSIAAGQGDPYIVLFLQGAPISVVDDLNLDALSRYVTGWVGDGAPYSTVAATDVQQWNWFKSNNKKVVPYVTAGWDKRPRVLNPMSWEPNPIPPNRWAQMPTPNELVNHISTAIDWAENNPTEADANTVIIYAWNEHDEGGFLCPTLDSYDGTARVDAMNQVFGEPAAGVRNVIVEWDFNSDDEGWNNNPNNLSLSWNSQGYLDGTILGSDPYVRNSQAISFTTTDVDYLELGIRNATTASSSQVILFTTTGNIPIDVPVTPNGTLFESAVVDLSTVSGWSNNLQVTDVRLDPNAGQLGSFSYDYIKFGNNDTIPITSLVLNGSSKVFLDSVAQMSVTIDPADASFQNPLYSVSDHTIATIDPNSGLFTPLNPGTVLVTAAAQDGTGIIDTLEVLIPNSIVSWDFDSGHEGWNSNPNNLSVSWNSLGHLECTITGSDPYVWNADSVAFATTNVNYLTVGVKNETSATYGQVILFTTSGNIPIDVPLTPNSNAFERVAVDLSSVPGWNNALQVTNVRLDPNLGQTGVFSYDYISFEKDPIFVESILLNGPSHLPLDSLGQMSVTVSPIEANNPSVVYTVDNTSLVTIDAVTGILTPILPGQVTVTATAQDGSGISTTRDVWITGEANVEIGWDFDTSDEGWSSTPNNLNVSWNSSGYLDMIPTGGDPHVYNLNAVSFFTTNVNYLEMQVKNESSATSGQVILFTTSGNVPITVPLTSNSQEYENVIVELSSVNGWNNNLSVTNVRLDPNDGQPGTVSLDHVYFVESYSGPIFVSAIDVSGPDTISLGTTGQMSTMILPTDATTSSVTYSVNDPSIATIDASTGLITPAFPGTVLVTAEAQDGSGVLGTKQVEVRGIRNAILGWDFDADDNGWNTNAHNLGVSWNSSGYLDGLVTGSDPYVYNSSAVSFTTADVNYLELRVKNATSSTISQIILFTTSGNIPVNVPVTPNSTAFEDIIFDLSTVNGWNNNLTVTNVRLDPNLGQPGAFTYDHVYFVNNYSAPTLVNTITVTGPDQVDLGSTGQVSVDVLPLDAVNSSVLYSVDDPSIATIDATTGLLTAVSSGTVLVTATAQDNSGVTGSLSVTIPNVIIGWDFDSGDQGWNANPNNLSVSWNSSGYLDCTITAGGDPYVYNSAAVSADATYINHLVMHVKNGTSAVSGQVILFTTSGNVPVSVPLTPNSSTFEEVFIDLSTVTGWNNGLTITNVRLDPTLWHTGSFSYDYVYFVNKQNNSVARLAGFSEALSLEVSEIQAPNIYPNPVTVNGRLFIELPYDLKGELNRLEIYDGMGRLVRSAIMKDSGKLGFEMDGLKPGLYFLNILSNNGYTSRERVIVK